MGAQQLLARRLLDAIVRYAGDDADVANRRPMMVAILKQIDPQLVDPLHQSPRDDGSAAFLEMRLMNKGDGNPYTAARYLFNLLSEKRSEFEGMLSREPLSPTYSRKVQRLAYALTVLTSVGTPASVAADQDTHGSAPPRRSPALNSATPSLAVHSDAPEPAFDIDSARAEIEAELSELEKLA